MEYSRASKDRDPESFTTKYFSGGFCLGDVLVRRSEKRAHGDSELISLEYRTVLEIPDIRKRVITRNYVTTSQTYYLTFLRDNTDLLVFKKPGIIFGGNFFLRTGDFGGLVSKYEDISIEGINLIDGLRVGSRGLDLNAIGEYILKEAQERHDLLSIPEESNN